MCQQTSVSVNPELYVPPELTDSELYHVFFSYSNTDYQWTHSVIEQVEARGLKVCYHERDFIPGRPILENMSESIQQSQKVLLVLSADFVRSRWCLLEANMSLFRDCLERKPVIPVLFQPDVSIPLHLCHLTFLEAQHPDFTNQLLKVLCTPNQQLQGSAVVPYQPPTIYNGKVLQPFISANEEELNKFDCGVWSDMYVPEQLRLIIQEPERYSEAIQIINSVSQTKVRFRSLWAQALVAIVAFILISLTSGLLGLIIGYAVVDNALFELKIVAAICLTVIFIWVMCKVALFKKNERQRIVSELQKAIGQANTLLFEENILMGAQSNSKIHMVYVLLDGCRRELTELFPEDNEVVFKRALLKYSCSYSYCLAKRHFPFPTPTNTGHLDGHVCFCQFVFHQLTMKHKKSNWCCAGNPDLNL